MGSLGGGKFATCQWGCLWDLHVEANAELHCIPKPVQCHFWCCDSSYWKVKKVEVWGQGESHQSPVTLQFAWSFCADRQTQMPLESVQSNLAKAALNPSLLTLGGSGPPHNNVSWAPRSLQSKQDLDPVSRFCEIPCQTDRHVTPWDSPHLMHSTLPNSSCSCFCSHLAGWHTGDVLRLDWFESRRVVHYCYISWKPMGQPSACPECKFQP